MSIKTGIGELKEETKKVNDLISEIFFVVPNADIELRKNLMKSYSSLTDLLEILKKYA